MSSPLNAYGTKGNNLQRQSFIRKSQTPAMPVFPENNKVLLLFKIISDEMFNIFVIKACKVNENRLAGTILR